MVGKRTKYMVDSTMKEVDMGASTQSHLLADAAMEATTSTITEEILVKVGMIENMATIIQILLLNTAVARK